MIATTRDGKTGSTAANSSVVPRRLAGHVSNQMLQRYSHIRSQAKQAAIRTLDEQGIHSNLLEHGQRTGQSGGHAGETVCANLLKTNSGPARIRTWDQRIMSPLL
jgi:hypothetical protein